MDEFYKKNKEEEETMKWMCQRESLNTQARDADLLVHMITFLIYFSYFKHQPASWFQDSIKPNHYYVEETIPKFLVWSTKANDYLTPSSFK